MVILMLQEKLDLTIQKDDLPKLVEMFGIGSEPKIYPEVRDITFWFPPRNAMGIFMRHAPEAFPNLERLFLDKVRTGDPLATKLNEEDRATWENLEVLQIDTSSMDFGVIFELFEFPKLHTLILSNPDIENTEMLVKNYRRWPEFKTLEISVDYSNTYGLFDILRKGGIFSHLERVEYRGLVSYLEHAEAIAIADAMFDESIPRAWRSYFFGTIRSPRTAKLTRELLKHLGTTAPTRAKRAELDEAYRECFPDWLFEEPCDEPPFDLTQLPDF